MCNQLTLKSLQNHDKSPKQVIVCMLEVEVGSQKEDPLVRCFSALRPFHLSFKGLN